MLLFGGHATTNSYLNDLSYLNDTWSYDPGGARSTVIAWDFPSAGFKLEQSSAPNMSVWTNAPNVPLHVGNEWQIRVQPADRSGFYRLHKQ